MCAFLRRLHGRLGLIPVLAIAILTALASQSRPEAAQLPGAPAHVERQQDVDAGAPPPASRWEPTL